MDSEVAESKKYSRCKLIGIRQCALCGVDVPIYHKDRWKRENIFCCKKHEGEFRKLHNPNYSPCCVCGKMVYRKPYQRLHHCINNIYCSLECMGKHRKEIMQGENNPNYNNIRRKDGDIMYKNNYIYERVIGHPFADEGGWVRQHRLVAEKFLLNDENSITIDGKRYLKQEYDVHHIDENKTNNDVSNLLVLTRAEHQKLHQKMRRDKRMNSN